MNMYAVYVCVCFCINVYGQELGRLRTEINKQADELQKYLSIHLCIKIEMYILMSDFILLSVFLF